MQRYVGVLLCLILLTFVYCSSEAESLGIVNTDELTLHLENRIIEEIRYLTDEDFQKLYTCKNDVRHEDESIVNLSQSDAWALMTVAKCEDCTDALSQAYIMSVLLNRLNSEEFPDSITEILEQDKQFSCLTDGRFHKEEPDLNSHMALYLIESGQVKTSFLYFEAKTCTDSWASKNRKFACEYGGTRFYY